METAGQLTEALEHAGFGARPEEFILMLWTHVPNTAVLSHSSNLLQDSR